MARGLVEFLDTRGKGTIVMLSHVARAELDRLHVRWNELGLRGEGLLDECANNLHIEVEQRRERPDIGHVLHEDTRTRVAEMLVAHARQRNPKDRDVRPG